MIKAITITILISILISCDRNISNDELISESESNELIQQNLRRQIISIDEPAILDSLRSIYIIPVGQRYLDKAENIDNGGGLGLVSSRKSQKRYYSSYNNLIIYFQKDKKAVQVMNERYLINSLIVHNIQNDILLTFFGIDRDSNNDGVINHDDLKSLFVYSIIEDSLYKIHQQNYDVLDYEFIPYTKDLLIQFGQDRDSNGTYEYKDEPITIKEFDYDNNNLIEILDKDLIDSLQSNLDGL